MGKLKRAALCTDIHFGRKNNSELHNEDCSTYIDWFIEKCLEYEADHIVFMGDWFEERDSINSLTSKYAMNCAIKLNNVGIPVYFIVGNHDLYYRDNRDVFASYIYSSLENFIMVDSPIVSDLTLTPTLYSPFLFEDEYPDLAQYFNVPIWMGHFEFKGFVLTGETFKKESGPDPDKFSSPTHIFSGHFHKRQQSKNITYIGNTFPMDFGDANDYERGMAIYDYEVDEIQFVDWDDCPKYMKASLTEIQDDPSIIKEGSRVKIIADTDITHSGSSDLKQKLMVDYNLREFNIEETITIAVSDGEFTDDEISSSSVTELVRIQINKIESDDIDNEMLIEIFDGL